MREMMVMVLVGFLLVAAFATEVRSAEGWTTLTIVEDVARGKVTVVDLGEKGDSPGDITTWHEPIMGKGKKDMGTSNGFCVRTVSGQVSECQWTLTMPDGSITLAGTEPEKGTYPATVTGGTGVYIGAVGEAAVTHNADGSYTLILKLKKRKV